MAHHGVKGTLYRSFGFLDFACSGILGLVLLSQYWQEDWSVGPPWFAGLLGWMKETALVQAPIWFLGAYVSRLIKRHVGPPRVRALVHDLLDELQHEVFKEELDQADPLHYHRATLFRHVTWRWAFCRWPGSGWLVPYVRSGHTTQKIQSVFRAPDDADKAEGIAGKTWITSKIVAVGGLPDLYSQELQRSPPQRESCIKDYAEKTKVDRGWIEERVRERRPIARSYCGIPVEVGSEMWGVIVLDSQRPDAKTGEEIYKIYRIFGRLLGKILERA